MQLGGVNYALIIPHDALLGQKASEEGIRWALNHKHLMEAEAKLGEDIARKAAKESYFFETLTHHMAKTAWKCFQKIEEKGSLIHPSAQKYLQKTLQEHLQQTQTAFSKGTHTLIGVNAYATPTQKIHFESIPPSFLSSATRWSAPFETLRWRSEQYFAQCPKPTLYIISDAKNKNIAPLKRKIQDLWGCLGFLAHSLDEKKPHHKEKYFEKSFGKSFEKSSGKYFLVYLQETQKALTHTPLLQAATGVWISALHSYKNTPKNTPTHTTHYTLDPQKGFFSLAQQIQEEIQACLEKK